MSAHADAYRGDFHPVAGILLSTQRSERLIQDDQRMTCREIVQQVNLFARTVGTITRDYLRSRKAGVWMQHRTLSKD